MLEQMAKAFNEWMRLYIEEPERFRAGWVSIKEFLQETETGAEPSYGSVCARYFQGLLDEVS